MVWQLMVILYPGNDDAKIKQKAHEWSHEIVLHHFVSITSPNSGKGLRVREVNP